MMTYGNNTNQFDPVETNAAVAEHADALRAYRRMVTHEKRQTGQGNKWGCSEKVRYIHAVTALMEFKTVKQIAELEESI
jgi:hypothetical protein